APLAGRRRGSGPSAPALPPPSGPMPRLWSSHWHKAVESSFSSSSLSSKHFKTIRWIQVALTRLFFSSVLGIVGRVSGGRLAGLSRAALQHPLQDLILRGAAGAARDAARCIVIAFVFV